MQNPKNIGTRQTPSRTSFGAKDVTHCNSTVIESTAVQNIYRLLWDPCRYSRSAASSCLLFLLHEDLRRQDRSLVDLHHCVRAHLLCQRAARNMCW